MNPVLILTHNCLELTKKCVESARKQDIPTQILFYDNGSTDGTAEWIPKNGQDDWDMAIRSQANLGVSIGWNCGLNYWFLTLEAPHVLVINNDTILPPWFYLELLSYDEGFVTGVAVDQMPTTQPQKMPLVPHPDFSAFLIRREVWEKVGPFDERMKLYASDCDYHVRAHRAGIKMWKANVPFYHERSSTLKKASPEERQEIENQANKDRHTFRSIYGCVPGEPAYYALFSEGDESVQK